MVGFEGESMFSGKTASNAEATFIVFRTVADSRKAELDPDLVCNSTLACQFYLQARHCHSQDLDLKISVL